MQDKGSVLVIGAGISGLTAAAAIGRRGWKVDVIERKPEISDAGGVGLSLVGNALRALNQIDVGHACVAAGMPADQIRMMHASGAPIGEAPLPLVGGPEWPGSVGIRRSVFHEILVEATAPVAKLRCGMVLASWNDDGTGVDVAFSDGSRARYDFVVSADGLYSSTRAAILPDVEPALTGQACWRVPVARPEDVTCTHLFTGGAHGVVGLCPVSQELAYVYIVETYDGERRDPATLDSQMRAKLHGYGGLIAQCAEGITDPAAVNFRPLEAMLAPAPWGAGRIVFIGDSVHANPPVIAQGAAMGIEDAIVLAEEVDAQPGDLTSVLDRFTARRLDRVRHVVDASCQLARWEIEKRHDVDAGRFIRESTERLLEPI
jgi:2-polyprenyl-6-methoxyphenol hydroxylase-like FAD-dependent oxidoreductase